MSATQCLRDEHQNILKALVCFDVALGKARTGKIVTKDVFGPFIEFFQRYADHCHHAKEEDCLFPCIDACYSDEMKRQMQVLLDEHVRARQLVKLMTENLDEADAGDPFATTIFLDQAQNYRDLIIGHIGGEDFRLFILADQTITGDELRNLNIAYQEMIEQEEQKTIVTESEAFLERMLSQYGSSPSEC